MHYEFPYGRTTLYHQLKKLCFKYQITKLYWRTQGQLHGGRNTCDRTKSAVCDQKITKEHWENYVGHVVKQEKEFQEKDHVTDNEIVIHLSDDNDIEKNKEEFV